MDLSKTFKLSEITKIFDIKRHFVIHLVEKGIIKPLVDVKGRGKSRLYSLKNLIEIGIFIYLTKLDLSYEMASRVLSVLKHLTWIETNDPGSPLMKYVEAHEDQTVATKQVAESAKIVPYISVLGFLNGKIDISVAIELYPDETTPENFLSKRIKEVIAEKKVKSIADLAYYFIVDVKNIVSYIYSRI